MVVEWAKGQAEKSNETVFVDVEELGLTQNGKPVKKLPVKDLTGDEWMIHQRSPLVMSTPGDMDDLTSPKSQVFVIVLTVARLKKGNPNLDLTPEWLKENWSMTRILKLVGLVGEALGEQEKNLESSPSPRQDNSS